jgi:T5SS/PEP-CTERM-associated repeat protein
MMTRLRFIYGQRQLARTMPGGTILLIVSLLSVDNAQGQTRFWNAPAGLWTNTANWSPMMVPNSTSDVEINNGGTATLDSAGQSQDVYLGRPLLSDGELEVISGAQLTSRDIWIGFDGGGAALVNGVGSTWTATLSGKLTVGNASDSAKHGELSIREGGSVIAKTTVIGSVDDSSGSILVDGSSLQVGTFTIGERGTATFQVTQGTIESGFTTIGKFDDPDPTKYQAEAIFNSGTWTIDSSLYVGDDGIGKLRIGGGTVSSSFYSAYIGRQMGSDGEVTTTGGTWTMGGIYVGEGGKGRLFIDQGTVKVQNSSTAYIGRLAGSDGEAVVSGSTWEINGGLAMADAGKGVLRVQSGSTLKTNGASMGSYAASGSDADVFINNSTWEDSGELQVLNGADLTLENNAIWTITATSTDVFDPSAQLDGNVATRPAITLNNSTWTNAGGLRNDTGKISIVGESTVTNTFGMLAFDSSDEAEVEVDGGTWDNTGRLTIGAGGKALLTVKNGGLVKSNTAIIADDASSIATAIVEGTGSRWDNTGRLDVGDTNGPGTQGTLIVRNGGEVTSTDSVAVLGKGVLAGNGMVAANVASSATVDPGYVDEVTTDIVPGTLQIQGNYRQVTGKLKIDLANAASDKLAATGNIELIPFFTDTVLEVSLVDGFQPAASREFDILDWGGSLTGTFTDMQLPALAAGLSWDTSRLYTMGVISVSGGSVPGDFNDDGVTNTADYVVWRRSGGSPEQYDLWRQNYGANSGAGARTTDSLSVPEPAGISLAMDALLLAAFARRRAGKTGGLAASKFARC